jgi:hypothetical protein
MNQPAEQFFLEGLFQKNKGGRLVFFIKTKAPATLLSDLSTLPDDIVRQIFSFLRTPSAECIVRQMFSTQGEHESLESFCLRGTPVHGVIWKNLDGWLVFRRIWFSSQRRADIFYKNNYTIDAREYAGHVSHQLWKEARERVLIYKYNCKNRMTSTKARLRQQLAMNNIFPTLRASRKTLWKLFMALD